MDGTKNKTDPPIPTIRSAIFKAVKVLPIPQAMINLPRSAKASPAITRSTAVT
jgi:hypothetical protein